VHHELVAAPRKRMSHLRDARHRRVPRRRRVWSVVEREGLPRWASIGAPPPLSGLRGATNASVVFARKLTRVLATATLNKPTPVTRGSVPNPDVAHLPPRRLNQHRLGAVFHTTHPGWRRNLHPERAATCKPRQ
jgi:hypothetical protein